MKTIWYPIIFLVLTTFACSSELSVSVNLLNPCTGDVIFAKDCNYLRVMVSSTNPLDPLHCGQGAEQLGPLKVDCTFSAGQCTINGSDLVGMDRIVDVFCFTDLSPDTQPTVRATSPEILLDNDSGGVGNSLTLLAGNVDGFVETTVLASGENAGQCSKLGGGTQGRYGHAATLLLDGRVLITGGLAESIEESGNLNAEDLLNSVEIFDPLTGEHRTLSVELQPRAFHTATTLRDGRVLIVGGLGFSNDQKTSLKTAQLFNPLTENFDAASFMDSGRAHHTATLLSTGEVLVTGGIYYKDGSIHKSGTIYDPVSGSWKKTDGDMQEPRAFHQAVLLDPEKADGKVLVIGGDNDLGPLKSVEIFNPQTKKFETDSNVQMAQARSHHCAVTLASGEVMVAGGKKTADNGSVEGSLEIYSYPNGFKEQDLNLTVARMDQTCTLLPTGDVLIAGGKTGSGEGIKGAELFKVGNGSFSVLNLTDDWMEPGRFGHSATILQNGWVYLAGGLDSITDGAQAAAQSEFFVPEPACD